MGRLDGSFHDYLAEEAESLLRKQRYGLVPLGDPSFTTEIRAVTKFRKRVYVPGEGIPLLSSKQLFQVAPIDMKRLGRGRHRKDMAEIGLTENSVVVTCSGTIGKVNIIPKYMKGWAASQDALRVFALDDVNAGFIYAWLSSDYGQCLVKRHSYGSVILHIDVSMLSSVMIPNATMATREEISDKVLAANALRNTAWEDEQKAIRKIEELISR